MLTWIKHLLWDEKAFIGMFRGLLLAFGTAVVSGQVPEVVVQYLPQWAGVLFVGAGGFVRSSGPSTTPFTKGNPK